MRIVALEQSASPESTVLVILSQKCVALDLNA